MEIKVWLLDAILVSAKDPETAVGGSQYHCLYYVMMDYYGLLRVIMGYYGLWMWAVGDLEEEGE
jgi:hypothetical protein